MSLVARVSTALQAVGADVKTINAAIAAGVKVGNKTLVSSTDQLGSVTINDDATPTTNWPNRLEFLFKPFGGTAQLTSWFNEYGEFRVTPGKVNTVALRIFSKTNTGDANHTGNVFEIQDNRNDRNVMVGMDAVGNITAVGTVSGKNIGIPVVHLATGAAIPAGTPSPALIART